MSSPQLSAQVEPVQVLTGVTQTQRLLSAAKLACENNSANLKSAIGRGTIKHLVHGLGDESPEVRLDADFQVYYQKPKFHIELLYAPIVANSENRREGLVGGNDQIRPQQSEQTIIFDGQHVYSIELSRDGNSHGDIYFDFHKKNILRLAGFPFEDPVELWSEALQIDRADLMAATTTELATGGFLGLLTKDSYRLKFYFFGEFGYDLRRVSSFGLGADVPFRDCMLSWRESNGIHYVSRYVSRLDEPPAPGAFQVSLERRQIEVEYASMDINVPVEANIFKLPSAPIAEGTSFYDHRISVDGKPKKLQWRHGELGTPSQ